MHVGARHTGGIPADRIVVVQCQYPSGLRRAFGDEGEVVAGNVQVAAQRNECHRRHAGKRLQDEV